MTEEERAAAFREEQAAQVEARRARFAALAGDPAAATALRAAWQPFIDYQREAREGAR